jgi:hypothetical protein
VVLFVVSFDTTVDATVDSFAEAAYREALATLLGVDASQIVTVVFAGSVIVQTEVALYETGAEAIVGDLQQLAEDADASADVFGAAATIDASSIRSVAVEAPSPPSESPPPETPPSSPSTNDFPWVWVWGAIGAALDKDAIQTAFRPSTVGTAQGGCDQGRQCACQCQCRQQDQQDHASALLWPKERVGSTAIAPIRSIARVRTLLVV